eukprot:9164686-Alexandrium_andersonii.AAC.1
MRLNKWIYKVQSMVVDDGGVHSRVEEAGRVMKKCRSPMVRVAVLKTWCNAWTTSHRCHEEEPVSYTHLTLPTICSV